MATDGGKICVHCGQDCSGKARTKDSQGRYMCKECVEKLKAKAVGGVPAAPAKKASVAAPPVEEDSILASLMADSPDPCPSCSAPLPKSAVICNFCGFNKATGQAAKTRVMRAPKEKGAKGERRPVSMSFSPLWTFLLTLGALGGSLALGMSDSGMLPVFFALFALCGLAAHLYMIISAFMDEHTGWGIVGIVSFVVGCLQLACIYYVFAVNERRHLKSLYGAYLLGVVMFLVVYAQNPEMFARFR